MTLLGDIDLFVKQSDTAPALTAELEDAVTGLPVDLTGVDSVKVTMRDPWDPTTFLVSLGTCEIVNPPGTDGLVKYVWGAGDIDQTGLWLAEFLVTDATILQRFPNDGYFRVAVVANLGVEAP